MSDTSRDLPAEFNPDSWPIGVRTASCMQQVPINKAYNDLDDCYQNGADLGSCRSKTGYDDVYNAYQSCIAGTDLVSVLGNASATTANATTANATNNVVNAVASNTTSDSLVSYAQAAAQPAASILQSSTTSSDTQQSSSGAGTASVSGTTSATNQADTTSPSSVIHQTSSFGSIWVIILQALNLLASIAILVFAYLSSRK